MTFFTSKSNINLKGVRAKYLSGDFRASDLDQGSCTKTAHIHQEFLPVNKPKPVVQTINTTYIIFNLYQVRDFLIQWSKEVLEFRQPHTYNLLDSVQFLE